AALSGTMGVGDQPAGVGLCPVVSVPRPLAGRAGAPGGQADARRTPGMRVRWREPPPPPGVGALGGPCLDLCGGHVGGSGHGLLGSVLPSDVWALAAGGGGGGVFLYAPRRGGPPRNNAGGGGGW